MGHILEPLFELSLFSSLNVEEEPRKRPRKIIVSRFSVWCAVKKRRRVTEVVSTEMKKYLKYTSLDTRRIILIKLIIHQSSLGWSGNNKGDVISSRRRGLNWKHMMFTKSSLRPRYLMLKWREFSSFSAWSLPSTSQIAIIKKRIWIPDVGQRNSSKRKKLENFRLKSCLVS